MKNKTPTKSAPPAWINVSACKHMAKEQHANVDTGRKQRSQSTDILLTGTKEGAALHTSPKNTRSQSEHERMLLMLMCARFLQRLRVSHTPPFFPPPPFIQVKSIFPARRVQTWRRQVSASRAVSISDKAPSPEPPSYCCCRTRYHTGNEDASSQRLQPAPTSETALTDAWLAHMSDITVHIWTSYHHPFEIKVKMWLLLSLCNIIKPTNSALVAFEG